MKYNDGEWPLRCHPKSGGEMQAVHMLDLGQIKESIANVAAHYDVARIYLFGSYARGEATPESDIDLCLETGPTFSLFSAGGFASAVEDALGRPVDVVTERSLYPYVREAAMKDRVLIYECA